MNPPDPCLSASAAGYCCELNRAGWLQIGAGVGGRVFHRTGDQDVIKVSDGDKCYLAFVDYAIANPRECLPHLTIAHRTCQWAVTHIEHLKPLSNDNVNAINQWWSAFQTARKAKQPLPLPESWSEVAHALCGVAIAGGCHFDMKEANAMQRGSTVVFIDPLN